MRGNKNKNVLKEKKNVNSKNNSKRISILSKTKKNKSHSSINNTKITAIGNKLSNATKQSRIEKNRKKHKIYTSTKEMKKETQDVDNATVVSVIEKNSINTSELEKIEAGYLNKMSADDPYLLEELENDSMNENTKWLNKQRTMVFSTRGISAIHRHLMNDIKLLLPHSVSEVKWEKTLSYNKIGEAAELNNCANVLFFEARKHKHLYLHLAKAPHGPTIKFQVFNIHTISNTNFLGNNIKYSRPILIFDKNFKENKFLELVKILFIQSIGTPRYHPKSKPFYDHIISFFWHYGKIYIRHYQILSKHNDDSIAHQELREIGPRFVLQPIVALKGCFSNMVIWKDQTYQTPTKTSTISKQNIKYKTK